MNKQLDTNPLREGLEVERTPDPCVMVIFGASGDLTKRKLMPALYKLSHERHLSHGFTVVGFSRSEIDHYDFRKAMKEAVTQFGDAANLDSMWESFAEGLFYVSADFGNPASYNALRKELERIDQERGTRGNRLFYLATPPQMYATIVENLGNAGLNKSDDKQSWQRIIVEKPFGRDLQSAQQLNADISRFFSEKQIYRIDHYLGKENVQNLLVFRFGNGMFEPIWNRNYIRHVQITAAETVGVEQRASYYEHAGALRDMVQNHLLQVLAHIAMEPPVTFDADAVRDEKVKVFRAIQPMNSDVVLQSTVRAQYGKGTMMGKEALPYKAEPGVSESSLSETYVALRLFVENWRWAGVPFYLRTGKRLPKRVTEVAIVFKPTPHMIFRQSGHSQQEANVLAIRIQPDEGISLKFGAKIPGAGMRVRPVTMDFRYGSSFGTKISDAYERLLLDCMIGDATLYARRDGVEACWSIMTPILEAWQNENVKELPTYEAGTWGPKEANEMIQKDGNAWRRL